MNSILSTFRPFQISPTEMNEKIEKKCSAVTWLVVSTCSKHMKVSWHYHHHHHGHDHDPICWRKKKGGHVKTTSRSSSQIVQVLTQNAMFEYQPPKTWVDLLFKQHPVANLVSRLTSLDSFGSWVPWVSSRGPKNHMSYVIYVPLAGQSQRLIFHCHAGQ